MYLESQNPRTAGVARAGSSGAGATGTCPGGFGMSPDRDTPHLPWAADPELCHPHEEKFFPHVGWNSLYFSSASLIFLFAS